MYLSFAWRYFKAKKSANAINIIAWVTTGVIAFATCCQVLVLSVFNGFEDLVKSLYSSFYTDLKVLPVNSKTFILDSIQIEKLRRQPSVRNLSMIAEEKALLQNEGAQTIVYLKGVDENYPGVSGLPGKVITGIFDPGNVDTPGIIVGTGIQNAASISVNPAFAPQQLTVILPRKNVPGNDPVESISEGNVIANGVFSIQQDFDNKYAITNIDFIKRQMHYEKDEYSATEISIKPGTDINAAKKSLQEILGNKFTILSRYEQNTTLYTTMKLEKWAIFAVLTLILIIASFNIVSALTMLVLEKKKDISILQSMGSTKSTILKIFLSEGLLLGIIGAASGILLAIIICILQIKYKVVKLNGGSFLIDYFPVKLIAADLLLVAVTVATIAFIASWLPAFKAARQHVELR